MKRGTKVSRNGIAGALAARSGRFGLVSHQATGAAERLAAAFPGRLAALFSPEHGFFGAAGAGEKTGDATHPHLGLPVFSLYGENRRPRREHLEGLSALAFSLQDVGTRCFTYLGTLALTLEAAAEAGVAVVVEDRPVPLGGVCDGLGMDPELESFVGPVDVPFCHGMTPGEAAAWIAEDKGLDIDLEIAAIPGWSHAETGPWEGWLPPSPALRSWDCAAAYPATVFCEAFPAMDCDRGGALAFRFAGAPLRDAWRFARRVSPAMERFGWGLRPYSAPPAAPEGAAREGVLLERVRGAEPLTASAGFVLLDALLRECPDEMAAGARPGWLDKLCGRKDILARLQSGGLGGILEECAATRRAWRARRKDLYGPHRPPERPADDAQ